MKAERRSAMTTPSTENTYLQEVMAKQAKLADDLRVRRASGPAGGAAFIRNETPSRACDEAGTDFVRVAPMPDAGPVSGNAVDVRVTGWWRWKSVVVPPNAYVVHTRRGKEEPLHCGLGMSFRFDPVTDSFMVVPATMQTVLINANCICRERQGILVQGYVQWIVDDFKTAYRKLDFSDAVDPMRVVNIQLREQAEAVIKDVVATMSIDDVLSDKQPIIKELVSRLRHVAEGDGQDKGLGLRIVTVQIKEAVVSSPRVWEMLQRPFRAERSREARLAELTHQEVVRVREAEAAKAAAAQQIATEAEVARLKGEADASAFDREQVERVRRARAEAETLAQTIAHEKEKLEKEAEVARLRLEHELVQEGMRQEAANRQAMKEIEFEGARRKVTNDISPTALQYQLVQMLPAIAEKMPHPKELKSFQVGGADGLGSLVSGLMRLIEAVREKPAA
jgi:regulator of protease activity HflC (stomatin/prohibitin superfamily)